MTEMKKPQCVVWSDDFECIDVQDDGSIVRSGYAHEHGQARQHFSDVIGVDDINTGSLMLDALVTNEAADRILG